MNIYTVSLFGHREIHRSLEMENKLEIIIQELIMKKEYIEFLVGREGDFDIMAASVIRRVTSRYEYGNTALILVLPYLKAEYRDNEQEYLNYYDAVEICEKSSIAHYKSAIQIRNKSMVDRSNLVICCIQHKTGGAYKTMQYAQKHGHNAINIAEIN